MSSKKTITLLTTIDNPFNPFTNFEEWKAYDEQKGYYTCEFLARITKSSEELSEEDQVQAVVTAIDEIIKENVLGLYKKIHIEVDENDIQQPN